MLSSNGPNDNLVVLLLENENASSRSKNHSIQVIVRYSATFVFPFLSVVLTKTTNNYALNSNPPLRWIARLHVH